jgi:hypothetical protein
MGVRRALLHEHVVAVVPPSHQTQIVYRREHRGPGSHNAPNMASQHLQPSRVPSLRTLIGCEADVLTRPQQPLECRIHPVDIAVVGNHEQGTPSAGQAGRGCHSQRNRPVDIRRLTRQSQPGRRRGVPSCQMSQE